MTPIAAERIVRSSLRAVLDGPGTIETRLASVIERLQSLPAAARRRITAPLKMRLKRVLRRKTAVVKAASPVSDSIRRELKRRVDADGMAFFEERQDRTLLAGFSFQEGDDRIDYSLRNKVRSLINNGNLNRKPGTAA
jgi:hypothetical protein